MNDTYNQRVLTVAHEAYPDSLVPLSYSDAVEQLHTDAPGDTLAVFVAIECCELADGATSVEQALEWAAGGMERAAAELLQVANALSKAAMNLEEEPA